jgi:hypothetical protein
LTDNTIVIEREWHGLAWTVAGKNMPANAIISLSRARQLSNGISYWDEEETGNMYFLLDNGRWAYEIAGEHGDFLSLKLIEGEPLNAETESSTPQDKDRV